MENMTWEMRRNSGPEILEMGPADFGDAWKRYDAQRARPVSSKQTAVTRSHSASRRYPDEKKLTKRSKSSRAMILPRGASTSEKRPPPSRHLGDFTRLTNQAAKLMASVNAVSRGKHDLTEGCKKWIVIVYTDSVFGMNSGFKFFIKFHGRKRSSKLIELQHSETNKFKFQTDQADVFTVVIKDVGEVERVTIGFKGLKPGITWRVAMVRLVDANDSEVVLEFPIDRDLDGDECYITMPREDLVFNESLVSSRLAATQYFELISSNVCQHPDFWYQFGGCQLHVPELGVCTASQRSGESGPSGLMQDVTAVLKWSRNYRVAFKAKLVSRQLVKSGGQVQCLLLSKQESRPKFDITVLATDILYSNHHSKLIEGKLEPENLLDGETTVFEKAYLCFVTNSVAEINLEVENPMLLDENDFTTNQLKNARFEVRTQIPEFWRSVGIGNLERKIVHSAKAVALKEKPFTSSGIGVNIKNFIKPDKNYQFSCDVILYLTDKEEVNRNGEMQADKSHMDEKAGIFCCLLTSRDPEDNWRKNSDDFLERDQHERKNKEAKEGGSSSDIVTTIAFTQVASFKKYTRVEGMFRIENRIPDMSVIALYCTEELQKFAVANATLKQIKPANITNTQ